MHRLQLIIIVMSFATACGSSSSPEAATGSESGSESSERAAGAGTAGGEEFQIHDSETAGAAHGDSPSQIQATSSLAAMRLFVIDPESGPIRGTVIKLTAPDGTAYYTGETDSQGYAEVLVPVAQRYQLEYLSLGRQTVNAGVTVAAGPNQDIRLTLRRRQWHPPAAPVTATPQPTAPEQPPHERFVLDGVLFDSGRATIQDESFPRLDRVVEYMTHMPNARIRISGYTDNVGNPERNRALSETRAQAVRTYLTSHGIDEARVEARGLGDQDPVASNDTEQGRAQNRRIEAIEL